MPKNRVAKRKYRKKTRRRKKSIKKKMRLSRKKTLKRRRKKMKVMKGGSMAGAFFQFLADVYSEDKQKKTEENSEEKKIKADEQKLRKQKIKNEMNQLRKEFEDKKEKKEDSEISALIDDSEEASQYVNVNREYDSDETSRGQQLSENRTENVVLEISEKEQSIQGGKKKKRKRKGKKRKRTFKKRKGGFTFLNFFKKGCDKHMISDREAHKKQCKRDKNCSFEARGSAGTFCYDKSKSKKAKTQKKKK